MDRNQIAGAAEQAEGATKEALGKLTGDTKLKVEGKAQKLLGKARTMPMASLLGIGALLFIAAFIFWR